MKYFLLMNGGAIIDHERLTFGDKDGAFDAELHRILSDSLTPARLALLVLESKKPGAKKEETLAVVQEATREWYDSLSVEGVRILLHAYLSGNRRWQKPSSDYLAQISEVLEWSMEVHTPGHGQFDAGGAAKTLVLSLFLFKVIDASTKSKQEQEQAVRGILEQALRELG